MGLKSFFSKKSAGANLETNKEISNPLMKALTVGSAAAMGSAQLAALWGMPQFSVPISVVAFLGGSLYSLLSSKKQQMAVLSMKNDGLTPKGKAITNGISNVISSTKKKLQTNNY